MKKKRLEKKLLILVLKRWELIKANQSHSKKVKINFSQIIFFFKIFFFSLNLFYFFLEFFSNVSSGNIDALKKQKKKFPSYWNINITDHNGKSALILSVINAALGEKTTTPILKFLFEDPDTDLLIRDL